MAQLKIPDNTTHVFINTKNKKSFYKNNSDGSWDIFNKGLETWEKVPKLDLTLIPLSIYLQNEVTSDFIDIESTIVDITNVTVKQENKETSHSELKLSFVNPPIDPYDYQAIYELFLEYNTNNYPLGFIPGEINYYVFYNHETKEWFYNTSTNTEFLTIYTIDVSLVKKVVRELNSSLTTYLTR